MNGESSPVGRTGPVALCRLPALQPPGAETGANGGRAAWRPRFGPAPREIRGPRPPRVGLARRRPDAEDAVLAVQDDLAIGGNEIGNHRREPDPEVHIGAIGEILRGPPGDLATFQRHQLPPISSPDFPVLGEAQTYAGRRHPARFHRCNELNRTRFSLLTWACNPG